LSCFFLHHPFFLRFRPFSHLFLALCFSLKIASCCFTAFTVEERDRLRLRGLLPPAVESLQNQRERAMKQLRSIQEPIHKYIMLAQLQSRNATLYFNLLFHHLEELLPIVYTPTVGLACQEFGSIWRVHSGMYLSYGDRGSFREILDNWREPEVDIIVVTDGSRILGLGDLGTNGMGIPIGKLALYVAAAGFHPRRCLPITIDAGTNNRALLSDFAYLGTRHERLDDEKYYPMLEEFMVAVNDKFPGVLVQFEDFSNDHCFELLNRYRNRYLSFNDDIQGTGAVVAAGYLNALKVQKLPHAEQRIVFYGAGSAATGIADNIVNCMVEDEEKLGINGEQCRKRFWFVDSRGLVCKSRGDELQEHKLPYARDDVTKEEFDEHRLFSLRGVVERFNPTVIIGCAGVGPAFDEPILRHMASTNEHPAVFALSNPTSKSECTAEDAYKFTDGKCVFASGSPFDPVTLPDGRRFFPGQANNFFIFPGLGYGAFLASSTRISDAMVTTSARALAEKVTEAFMEKGRIYPDIKNVREISAHIAVRVIQRAKYEGVARLSAEHANADYGELLAWVTSNMYVPEYLPLDLDD
jgi:malate dehydrogenase (oxaloacetate-decarboxylating)(NADP+)